MRRMALIVAAFALAPLAQAAERPPSVPDVDAPELAALGSYAVGVSMRTITLPDRVDAVGSIAAGHEVRAPRELPVRIWYPAAGHPKGATVLYHSSTVGEEGQPRTAFTVPGIAHEGAKPADGKFPIVVLSHGYGNNPVMLSWLTENLASKGYVVVAPEHRDPPNWDRAKTPGGLLSRPLDITAVLAKVRSGWLGAMGDTARIGLVGYSFGGYGVLTVGGGQLDSHSPAVTKLPADLVSAYADNGPRSANLHADGIKAIVAISPAGGAPWSAWGPDGAGLSGITAPLLVLVGSNDHTVGYEQGPVALYTAARHSDRNLLIFEGAGHGIGTGPTPPEMHSRLWDFDWFADPIWRKDRLNAIETHFITAFLDQHLKGDATRASYFAVPNEVSDNAGWKGDAPAYAAMSKGGDNPTWKGFWRGRQDGLILRHRPAE